MTKKTVFGSASITSLVTLATPWIGGCNELLDLLEHDHQTQTSSNDPGSQGGAASTGAGATSPTGGAGGGTDGSGNVAGHTGEGGDAFGGAGGANDNKVGGSTPSLNTAAACIGGPFCGPGANTCDKATDNSSCSVLFDSVENTIQDRISMLQVKDSALADMTIDIARMRDLAVLSSNGDRTNSEREVFNQEYALRREDLKQIAANTAYSGIPLLAPPTTTIEVNVAVPGFANKILFNIGDFDVYALGPSSSSVGASSIEVTSSAQAAISSLDVALGQVNNVRESTGAAVNRLTFNAEAVSALRSSDALPASDGTPAPFDFSGFQPNAELGENVCVELSALEQNLQTTLTAYNAVTYIEWILEHMHELSGQASNGDLTHTDREYLNQEYQGLMEDLRNVAELSTCFGQGLVEAPSFSIDVSGTSPPISIPFGGIIVDSLGAPFPTGPFTNFGATHIESSASDASIAKAMVSNALSDIESRRSAYSADIDALLNAKANY